jgi:cis-3-alkyl-4-acyloxetan-2-one decarboxylase
MPAGARDRPAFPMSANFAAPSALYPFESRYFDLGGIRYHYLDEGSGEPIVMLHGNPTWSFYYRHLIVALRSEYRIVVPDHIGCGLSDKPQRYDYCLGRHIANLETLISRLALERVTLVMHDWGGPIGMGYAVRHPTRVARFVVFNTAAFWLPRVPGFLRLCRLPVLGALVVRRLNLFALLALSVACRRRERMTSEVREGYLAPYDSYANRVAILRFVQDIPVDSRHRSFGVLQTIEAGLAGLRDRPMLVVWGGKDPVFTEPFLAGWKERFPQAAVKRVDEAGHYVVEDAYERIIPWMREFLSGHPV